MKLSPKLILAVAMPLAALRIFAAVTVTENISPGAGSWPGNPLLGTVVNPGSQLPVGESFGAATSISETFTVPGPNNYSLQSICLYAGGGTGTSETATVTLNLYDLGGHIAPNPGSYSPGINLLGNGKGLPIGYTTQPNGLLRLDFDGRDQALLIAGHMYAFELAGVSGTTPINWFRTISDTYPDGAAYRNRAWINGTNARDFGMAVYGAVNTSPVPPTEATISGAVLHQQIDGFGAGAVFLDAGLDPLTDADMDALYGTGPSQMGLTLIRLRIAPDGNWTNAILDGQKAKQRAAKILATPWTPPASMKDNNSLTNGGSVISSQYPNLVAYFNSFTGTMASNGAPVDVLSIQNEPDFTATYESCRWNASQLDAFFRDFASGVNTPMMMPESFHYDQTLSNPTLNDSAAAANVAYIGEHLYGAGIQDYPLPRALGKHIWMTEYLVNDQTIAAAVDTAQQISGALTTGNMSAYIWWKTIGNANGLLNAAGVLQPRAYVMAQFSKFVRPGDFRIDVPFNSSPLGLSAFMEPISGRFAIVAVNDTTLPVTQSFTIDGVRTTSLTPWITSATQSLEQQSPLDVSKEVFTYTAPSFSVLTFTGILDKLTMCHNGHAILIDRNAVPAHLAIGDQVGGCS
jgi:glucuronoarabinoxylan endo-1,4-beta-xylanase